MRQRIENDLDDERHQDDGHAPVVGKRLDDLEQLEERCRQEPQEPVVHRQVEVRRNLFEAVLILRACVESRADDRGPAGRNRERRARETDDVGSVSTAIRIAIVGVLLAGIRDPRTQEVVLQHRDPPACHHFKKLLVAKILEIHLFVACIDRRQGSAEIGPRAKRESLPGFRQRGIPLELREEIRRHRFGAPVVNLVRNVHQV